MSCGYASKRNMANGRGIPYPTPQTTGITKRRLPTKMKFSLRERIKAWLFHEGNDSKDMLVEVDSDGPNIDMDNAINFSVVNAAGGRIVQVRHYDRIKDRNFQTLHIITPDEDLATALAHILVIDHLSR